jgi:hypothetical protein
MKKIAIALAFITVAAGEAFAQQPAGLKDVSYKNVTFSFDASLAQEYLAETVRAVPLVNKTDKPDGVWPEHILITFRESYVPAQRRQAGGEYSQVKLFVFPTSDSDNREFAKDFPTTKQAVDDLTAYLVKRSHPHGEPVPFLPWADVGQAFVGKRKILRFRNGRGVLFLTQYGQEKIPLNNNELVYTFQGLTDDNAWFVSALFPVVAPGLPAAPGAGDTSATAQSVDRALGQAAQRLEKLSGERFKPSLTLLEKVIRSLKIGPK